MLTIEINLVGDLARLPPRRWETLPPITGAAARFVRRLAAPTTVKDLLEALGVPHGEIGEVAARGRRLEPDHLLTSDLVLTVTPTLPAPLADPRFICDQHLGSLARLLRMLGFDTAWDRTWREPAVARRAANEGRVVLSRSRALLKRRELVRALLVRSDQVDRQAAQVLRRFLLAGQVRLCGRCTLCNGLVDPVARDQVLPRIPPRTRLWLDQYHQCRNCDHLYWEGTHVAAVRARLAALLAEP